MIYTSGGARLPGHVWRVVWRAQRGVVRLPLRAWRWLLPFASEGWLGCVEVVVRGGGLELGPSGRPMRHGLVAHAWDLPLSVGTHALVLAWPLLGSVGVDPLLQVQRWLQRRAEWSQIPRGASGLGGGGGVTVRLVGPAGLHPVVPPSVQREASVRLRRAGLLPAFAVAERWYGRDASGRLRRALVAGSGGVLAPRTASNVAHDALRAHRALAARMRGGMEAFMDNR